jgi:hypothetical protein
MMLEDWDYERYDKYIERMWAQDKCSRSSIGSSKVIFCWQFGWRFDQSFSSIQFALLQIHNMSFSMVVLILRASKLLPGCILITSNIQIYILIWTSDLLSWHGWIGVLHSAYLWVTRWFWGRETARYPVSWSNYSEESIRGNWPITTPFWF